MYFHCRLAIKDKARLFGRRRAIYKHVRVTNNPGNKVGDASQIAGHPVPDVTGVTNGKRNPDEEGKPVGEPGMLELDSTNGLHASAEALGSATIYYFVCYGGIRYWSFGSVACLSNARSTQSSSGGCNGNPITMNERFTSRKRLIIELLQFLP
jgi:hypothetical protein